jgi:hypothetical protein
VVRTAGGNKLPRVGIRTGGVCGDVCFMSMWTSGERVVGGVFYTGSVWVDRQRGWFAMRSQRLCLSVGRAAQFTECNITQHKQG